MAIHDHGRFEPLTAGRKRPQTNGADRTCVFPGCTTRLSLYNANDRCWSHVRAPVPQSTGESNGR